MKYLIIDQSRSGINGAYWWWLPNRLGYTTNIDKAGRYTADEVAEIIEDARGKEWIFAEEDLSRLCVHRIGYTDNSHNRKAIEQLHAENCAAITARPAPAGSESEGV